VASRGGWSGANQLVEALLNGVRTFTKGRPQGDDVTALVVRYRGNADPLPART